MGRLLTVRGGTLARYRLWGPRTQAVLRVRDDLTARALSFTDERVTPPHS